MRPKDDTRRGSGSTGGAPTTLEKPDPINGPTTYLLEQKIQASGDQFAASPTISVNGEVIESGEQTAKALALLGIDEVAVDLAWTSFMGSVNYGPGSEMPPSGYENWARDHQEDMSWQIEVTVANGPRTDIDGLAYIDPRTASREVTYRARKWPPIRGGFGTPVELPTTSTVVSKAECLEPSGAVGASWSGVSQEDIDSTKKASAALHAARMDLDRARKEIEVAIKVANAAWRGPRSEATKFKFGLEYELITAAKDVTYLWEQYVHDLVTAQRKAKEHDEKVRRELIAEGVMLIIPYGLGRLFKFVVGAGRAAKAEAVGQKVWNYAGEIVALRRPLMARLLNVTGQITRSAAATHSVRILARGLGDATTEVAVDAAADEPTTGWDWFTAFAIAGALGHGATEGLSRLLEKYNVKLPAIPQGAAKGAADGGSQTAFNHAFTDEALAAPFASTVGSEAIKEPIERRYTKVVGEMLGSDGAAHERAVERVSERNRRAGTERYPEDFWKQVDNELEKEAGRRVVSPALDYVYGAGAKAVAEAHGTATEPPPAPDLPDAPLGTVPRRTGGE